MRILFFGTPQIAAEFLKDLLATADVVGVITQPDRPASRGQQLQAPAVKVLALEKHIPVFQPEKFTPEVIEQLKALKPDIGVVVSYGKLIPPSVFTLPKFGCFNIHFSLLPKYRGAAPVQWALINGETQTGVTSFWIEKSLDSGPILVQKAIPVAPEDDSATLMRKLICLGIEVMHETLDRVEAGNCMGTPQEGEPSYAPSLKKEEGLIHWDRPAGEILNRIRGTKPWPGAYTFIGSGKLTGKMLKIVSAHVVPQCPPEQGCLPESHPGQIAGVEKSKGFVVRCGSGFLQVDEVHPQDKKQMSAWAFWQGGQLNVGDSLNNGKEA